jgi:monoamine oxidase
VPLAQKSGLSLVPTDYEDAIARDTVTGRRSTAAESRASTLEGLIGRLERAWPPVDTSVGSWLTSQGWSDSRLDAWAEAVEITQEYGLDPRRLGVRATEEGADYRGGDAMVAGGYVAIVDDLLAGSDVRLSTAVESVSARGSRAEVTLQSGARVTADIAVVAVPLALVRAGRPKLPDMTGGVRAALRRITTGNLEKVVLRYDEQWWGDHQVYGIVGGGAPGAPEGSPASLRWTEFYSLTDVLGFPALVGFSGGSAARSRPASDSGCVREATAALAAAFAR